MLEEQTEHQHGQTAANAIKFHVAQALAEKMESVMTMLAEVGEVTLTFAHKIDMTDVKPTVKSKMTFTKTDGWKGQSTMDDPSQGTFEFVGADTGQGHDPMSAAAQGLVDAIQESGASATITGGGQAVEIPAKRGPGRPKKQAVAAAPEATHYPDINIAQP